MKTMLKLAVVVTYLILILAGACAVGAEEKYAHASVKGGVGR